MTRRRFVVAGAVALGGAAWLVRRRISQRLSSWTQLPSFTAAPVLMHHDPGSDRRTLCVARESTPGENIDAVLRRLGGIETVVGPRDVVLLKVSAQWWNQGMTNVAATRRMIERILAREGFSGEVIVFENVHFRLRSGSPLARGWTHPSERNVDVEGWRTLGDLIPHFARLGAPVSFVGLVDAGASYLSGDAWHDPSHEYGVYGGDGRGPIQPREERDGYHWDFAQAFRVKRSLVDYAQTPLTWPVFRSPHSGVVVDLRDGAFRIDGGRRVRVDRKVTWISMTTANEHNATGYTGAVKSAMGVVDMSAGLMGSHPLGRDYESVHSFGSPDALWRMAGPLAHFARRVRHPDLYVTVAEWVGATPHDEWDHRGDARLHERAAHHVRAVVAGTDPVAVDTWSVRNLLMPIRGAGFNRNYDLDNPQSQVVKFLRYYRQVFGSGTMDLGLVTAVASG